MHNHGDILNPLSATLLNVSICSIFKDEANNLPVLIQGIPLDKVEWIVLDTGSKDLTCEILSQAGITPIPFLWIDDFSAARNKSLSLATREWILWLDGDDRLDQSFWKKIEPLLKGPKQAYRFIIRSPRENSFGEQFRQIRLFPNHLQVTFEGKIHEQLGTSLEKLAIPIANTELEIVHTGYDTEAKRKIKLLRNRALLEHEYADHPNDVTVSMEYGNCLYQCGEYSAAKSVYLKKMPSPNPKDCITSPQNEVLLHFPALLGETCLKLAHANPDKALLEQEASDWFQIAIEWNPKDIQPFYWLGKKQLAVNNIYGALELFYTAIDQPVHVGRVATDNFTVRRNTLALIVLCECKRFGPKKAPRLRQCLNELIVTGLDPFPLDYQVPWEYLRTAGFEDDAEEYAKKYLTLFTTDWVMWENYLESLFAAGRYREIVATFQAHPQLELKSGVLEAFRAKSLDVFDSDKNKIYELYHTALKIFPQDPTLLVYFSDFVNHNNLYAQCYTDLKALPKSSETILEFLRQMETQGLGTEGHVL